MFQYYWGNETPKKTKYLHILSLLIAVFAIYGILHWHFLPMLFTTMLTFLSIRGLSGLIEKVYQKLNKNGKKVSWGHHWAAGILATLITGIIAAFSVWIYHKLATPFNFGQMVDKLGIILSSLRDSPQMPDFAKTMIPQNITEIKRPVMDLIKAQWQNISHIGTGSLHILGLIVLGMVLGVMFALPKTIRETENHTNIPETLTTHLNQRILCFTDCFQKVFIAQMKISAINAALTGIFLYIVLPVFGVSLPFKFSVVILTFIFGMIPFGNLVSNSIIFILSLQFSLTVAICSLLYLVIIHKLEYFLNAKIIGNKIQSQAWELILAMTVAASVFGIGGVVIAPIAYAYCKEELQKIGLIS